MRPCSAGTTLRAALASGTPWDVDSCATAACFQSPDGSGSVLFPWSGGGREPTKPPHGRHRSREPLWRGACCLSVCLSVCLSLQLPFHATERAAIAGCRHVDAAVSEQVCGGCMSACLSAAAACPSVPFGVPRTPACCGLSVSAWHNDVGRLLASVCCVRPYFLVRAWLW
jgi:hypothetical protein